MPAFLIKKGMVAMGVVGLFIVVVIIVLVILKRRFNKPYTAGGEPSAYALAVALETVLKGSATIDLLGQLVYDALKQGNFRAFRGTLAMEKEISSNFSGNDQAIYLQVIKDEEKLRQSFDAKRAQLLKAPGDYLGVEPNGEPDIRFVRGCHILIGNETNDSTGQIVLGDIIRTVHGWKLLKP